MKLAAVAGANGDAHGQRQREAARRNVFLASGAVDGFFEDNYFDVLPGETATVAFKPRTPTTPAALQAALTATSIADSD